MLYLAHVSVRAYMAQGKRDTATEPRDGHLDNCLDQIFLP